MIKLEREEAIRCFKLSCDYVEVEDQEVVNYYCDCPDGTYALEFKNNSLMKCPLLKWWKKCLECEIENDPEIIPTHEKGNFVMKCSNCGHLTNIILNKTK